MDIVLPLDFKEFLILLNEEQDNQNGRIVLAVYSGYPVI